MVKKALPNVPNSQDRQQVQFQQRIKELIEIGEGVRGDPLDRKITLRDLLGSGIAHLRAGFNPGNTDGGNGLIPGTGDDGFDGRTPPKPTGVLVTPGLGTIFISWDKPGYGYHGFAQIYRSSDDNFANATIIGTAAHTMYVDNVQGSGIDPETGDMQGFYYWVSFVSEAGLEGPPHDVNGLYGAPAADPEYMLKLLEGKLTETQLHENLTTRLSETDETLVEQAQTIEGLNASYTVKIDSGGRVAGYGLAAEANEAGETTSSFIINADQFGIFHPGASQTLVFGVFDGKTVMDGAFIKNGTIGTAQIGTAAINSAHIKYGSIQQAHIGNAAIGSAQLAGVIQSDNYSATSGWAIYKNGLAYFNDAVIRGTAQSQSYNVSKPGWQLKADGSFTLRGAGGKVLLTTAGVPANSISGLGLLALKDKVDNATYIAHAVVDTLHLAGQAVTIPASIASTGSSPVRLSFNPQGGNVLLVFTCEVAMTPYVTGEIEKVVEAVANISLKRGSSVLQRRTLRDASPNGIGALGNTEKTYSLAISWLDTSGSRSTNTYSIDASYSGRANIQNQCLTAISTKR